MAESLALYRNGYLPSEAHPEPRTFLTVNAVVAETAGRGGPPRPAEPPRDGGAADRLPAHRADAGRGRGVAWLGPAAREPGLVDARPLDRRYPRRRGQAGA